MDDMDEDFASFFDDFNDDPETFADLSERLSDNLRAQVGIAGNSIVHEGEGDEGRVTWEAPAAPGLQNDRLPSSAAEVASDSLWAELADEDEDDGGADAGTAMSANIFTEAKQAAEDMDDEEASNTAALFDKFAAHGKGFAVIDRTAFQELVLQLTQDPKGQKLLKLLMSKKGGAST